MRLVLSDDAVADLRGIVRYAAAKWRRARARAYLQGLNARFDALCAYPELGQKADEVAAGTRRYSYVSHSIYYRIQVDRIRILRILHKRMRAEDYAR